VGYVIPDLNSDKKLPKIFMLFAKFFWDRPKKALTCLILAVNKTWFLSFLF
jgi:hypothetical protein